MGEWRGFEPDPRRWLPHGAGAVPPSVGSDDVSASAVSAGDLQAIERAGERRLCPHVVDLFLRTSGQPLLRALARPVRAGTVDLLRQLRRVCEDDDLVVAHLAESAGHRRAALVATDAIRQLADAECGEKGGVARQDTEVAFDAGHHDLVDLL